VDDEPEVVMVKHLLLPALLLSTGVLAASQATPAQPRMADMMQRHQQMMAEMQASDQKLYELVRTMNAATGDAKITVMAQAITELARQQQASHEHMRMMEQMAMGMMSGQGTTTGK
jgi:hypothetical protein